jgi:hypothetical protein
LPGSAAPIASFSERGGDLLDVVRPGLECALRATAACGRLARALAANPPPGTAVVLLDHYGEIERSSLDAERWLGEHFGGARARGLAARNRAGWLVLPPRPPLVSMRDGRRLTVNLGPGDPHRTAARGGSRKLPPGRARSSRPDPRETEVLSAATHMEDEADIAWELSLSLHAVRDRLARLEAKLGAHRVAGRGPGAPREHLDSLLRAPPGPGHDRRLCWVRSTAGARSGHALAACGVLPHVLQLAVVIATASPGGAVSLNDPAAGKLRGKRDRAAANESTDAHHCERAKPLRSGSHKRSR